MRFAKPRLVAARSEPQEVSSMYEASGSSEHDRAAAEQADDVARDERCRAEPRADDPEDHAGRRIGAAQVSRPASARSLSLERGMVARLVMDVEIVVDGLHARDAFDGTKHAI